MIDGLNKLTFAHFFYVLGAGAAAGALFVLLDRYLLTPGSQAIGLAPQGPVI